MRVSPKHYWTKIPKRLRSKRILASIVLVFVAWFILSRGAANTELITTTQVEEKSIKSQVSASGIVKSDQQTKLIFHTPGKVVWVYAKEGDYVTRGKAIASIDTTILQANLRQAQQNVENADAILAQTKNNIHINGVENFDERVMRLDAETRKDNAFDEMRKAEKALAEATIYAPFSGTITSLNVVPGQEAGVTTEVGEIANVGNIEFSAQVDETDVRNIRPGQTVSITLDAFDEPFETTVSRISDIATQTTTGATAFEAIMALPNQNDFKIGYNGEALITTAETENAIVIPIDALVEDNSVWVKENGTYKKVQVETGLGSDTEVEVKNGLSKDQTIVTSGFAEINKRSLLDKILRR